MEKRPQKQDNEWGIGENADGTITVFDLSDLPAQVAKIEEAERAAIAREPKNLAAALEAEAAALEAEAKAGVDVSDLDDYDDVTGGE